MVGVFWNKWVDNDCYSKSFLNISKWSSSESCEEGRTAINAPSIANKAIVTDKLRFPRLHSYKSKKMDYSLSFLSFVLSTMSHWFHTSFENLDMFSFSNPELHLIRNQKIFSQSTRKMIWKSFNSHWQLEVKTFM